MECASRLLRWLVRRVSSICTGEEGSWFTATRQRYGFSGVYRHESGYARSAAPRRASASLVPSGPPVKRMIVTVAIDPSATKAVAILRPDLPVPVLLIPPNADEATLKAGTRAVRDLVKDFGPKLVSFVRRFCLMPK